MNWNNNEYIDLIASLMMQDRVVLGDSDTILGLLANTTQKGRLMLDSIKKRQEKPYIILIENISKAINFVDQEEMNKVKPLLISFWPGPLTVIFKAKDGLPSYLQGENGTVALRVPQHKGLLALLRRFDGLFSTSANLSGQPVPQSIEEVDRAILDEVALIVLDEPSNQSAKPPSTIIDCAGTEIRLIFP